MDDTTQLFQFLRPSGILPAILVIFASWLAARTLSRFAEGLGARFTQRRLLLNQSATIFRLALYFIAGMAVVALVLDLSREAWLAAGGTVAVALGFAFKDFAASIVAGIMILVDRPFQVGDRITFGTHYGEVHKIGLRMVRIVTLDDSLVTIPNNKFLTDPVTSGNAGALDMMIEMSFHVGVDQNLDVAMRIVRDALTSSRYAYIEKPWAIVVTEIIQDGYFALRLTAKAYVLDVQYEKAFQTDVTARVHRAFREQGIRPPSVLHRGVGDVDEAARVVEAA
jgi:small-conductance mechanosensitive channel